MCEVILLDNLEHYDLNDLLAEELLYLFNSKIINRIVNNFGVNKDDLKYPNIYFKINVNRYNDYCINKFKTKIEEIYKIEDEYLEENGPNYIFIIKL